MVWASRERFSSWASYGVKLPGHEGRACMVALELKPGRRFDPQAFYRCVTATLPEYAQPLFVRILPAAEVTKAFVSAAKLKATKRNWALAAGRATAIQLVQPFAAPTSGTTA